MEGVVDGRGWLMEGVVGWRGWLMEGVVRPKAV